MPHEPVAALLLIAVGFARRVGHEHARLAADGENNRQHTRATQLPDPAIVVAATVLVDGPVARAGMAEVGDPPTSGRGGVNRREIPPCPGSTDQFVGAAVQIQFLEGRSFWESPDDAVADDVVAHPLRAVVALVGNEREAPESVRLEIASICESGLKAMTPRG